MKRFGGLWEELVSWSNLRGALECAARGKRSRPDIGAFLLEWETRLIGLQRELRAGGYVPGGYRTFLVREPKPRRISAAPFRDRVVHHALTQVLERREPAGLFPSSCSAISASTSLPSITRFSRRSSPVRSNADQLFASPG